MSVRFGFGLGTQQVLRTPTDLNDVVDGLEEFGFDSLWLSERVTGPPLDPLATMGYVAGRSSRLKFGTSVLVLPGRNPVLLAKELATLDVLSQGRLLLAFGLGIADPGEQQAFGVQRAERGALFEEALPLMRRLWREEDVTHHGDNFHVDGITLHPRAVGRMEAWHSGNSPSELRRTGRLADGWLGSLLTPEEAGRARETIQEQAAQHDRKIDDDHFGATVIYAHDAFPPGLVELVERRRPGRPPEEVVARGADALVSLLEGHVAAGLSKFVVVPSEPSRSSWRDELGWLSSLVHPLQD